MADISGKEDVLRIAIARGAIKLKPETIQRIREKTLGKGDVVTTAQIAGILAAKKTPEIIPLCHPIPITKVDVQISVGNSEVTVESTVQSLSKTGVEMEALVATSVALLTVWDMVKPYEKDQEGQYPDTEIEEIRVVSKTKQSTKNSQGREQHETQKHS
ncbi:MAG: cyclic pyranopterin monophosphate synthase MoaC [Candidatus Freyarchaeota archaeon]|nr:cyclic pyranopterin monophosphate synthase MoaC [Candidatus Jordarchaeia archaeon]MBS7269466.1 cyclic pyranopterin monophosphate synthase MoaC [Candidatus Jordarchaeia archaeon]MBS7278765.1 cyclic pyranopterin monophosphate synthase MoaC [Candidatus Jordarchaeia archaeon]